MAPETALVDASSPEPLSPSKLHNGRGSRLTVYQLQSLVALHKLERTQAQIAQAIGCDQATVCRYLKVFTPTGDYADAFLRSKQGKLAEKFLENAKGSDILDLLERYETIPAKKADGRVAFVVSIGGLKDDSDVQIDLGSPVSS